MKNREKYKTPEEQVIAFMASYGRRCVTSTSRMLRLLKWLDEEYEPKGLRCCPICGKWSKIEKHTTFSQSRRIKCPHCGGLAIEQCWHHNYT